MKKTLLIVQLFLFSFSAFAQLNMSLVGQLDYNTNLSDIWGWVDPDDGTEYAIVGLGNGTSVVSLADPENPLEVLYIPGQQSTWRDIKTWGEFVYVTTDQPGTTEGLLIIDMTDAPDNITFENWNPEIAGEIMNTCHNIYIDEFGYAYLAGCNNNNGGMIVLDVFTTPGTPTVAGLAPPTYSHDVYTRDNIMYSSEIFAGHLGVYDVTDKNNITLEATQPTEFEFTHNAWLNDAGTVVFTTDELANAPIGAYDISDLDNIVELDQFVPIATMGLDVIPHNVHVWDDWLLISYYTDGGIVVDASNPSNLIEVGNYDTFLGGDGGFSGAWGLYPFLPSGLVLVSDINSGLYVLEPNLVRACFLEGFVTDINTNAPIFNAQVIIDSPQPNLGITDLTGEYKTGQAIPGVFDVTVSASGYISETVEATLENGVITLLDVQLGEAAQVNVAGQTVQAESGSPLGNVVVRMFNDNEFFETVSDGNGNFNFPAIFEGDYTVAAAIWGRLHYLETITIAGDTDLTVPLERGYQDDFFADLGWTTDVDGATTGFWVRAEPNGTSFGGSASNPGADTEGDIGVQAFVTGNSGQGGAGNDDIDDGDVILLSPIFNLLGYNEPLLTFDYWFFNEGGQGNPNDQMEVKVSNGDTEVVLFNTTESAGEWFNSPAYLLTDFISLTENMQLIVTAGDQDPGHLVEVGFDKFLVEETALYPPFSVSSTVGCLPQTIQFEDLSDSTATYTWTFEGGTPATSTLANPAVTYDAAGIYDVFLTVTTNTGNTFDVNRPDFIEILDQPTADFNATVNGQFVSFENTSIGGATYFWDFGDMATSTDENPSHSYLEVGTYNVTLTTTNVCGESTTTFDVTITSVPPIAVIGISSTSGCVPFEVTFADNSTGTPTEWFWELPGADTETSTEQNPTVTYNAPGTYSVSLTVTNDAGTSDAILSQIITVGDVPNPNFDVTINANGEVVFTNLTDDGLTYFWDFGDDNESQDENPTHVYSADGEYTVSLTATNDCGQTTFTQDVMVVITDVADVFKNVRFEAFPNPFAEDLTIEFSAEEALKNATLNVYNSIGQLMETQAIEGTLGQLKIGQSLHPGLFFVTLEMEGEVIQKKRIVKVN